MEMVPTVNERMICKRQGPSSTGTCLLSIEPYCLSEHISLINWLGGTKRTPKWFTPVHLLTAQIRSQRTSGIHMLNEQRNELAIRPCSQKRTQTMLCKPRMEAILTKGNGKLKKGIKSVITINVSVK